MKTTAISKLKTSLSEYLLKVKAGEEVIVTDRGKPVASVHVSPRYIEKTIEETAVPNMVTSLLADYRGYDTNFEETVILTAGVPAIMLLRRPRK